jgi:HD superfamily phosphohydrolase
MSDITFADVVHQSVSFSKSDPAERLILSLIDTRWFQRLRDISQTANTRLVYMFSEHSRFGHCLGVAYLAKLALSKLSKNFPEDVEAYRPAILVAALLHDIGHLAPGSHTAFKTWFPGQPDVHEELAETVLTEDPEISSLLSGFDPELAQTVLSILEESASVPAWTWQIISGGGWNVDRGNWSTVDSVLAGVSYGKYNIPALVDSILITEEKQLALMENRLDAMLHFMVSRHAMYRQIYQHRVLLAADMLNKAVVQRARDLGSRLEFADEVMQQALAAKSAKELTLATMFEMRESWWRYHMARWSHSQDPILSDLSDRILHRRLFKTVRVIDPSKRPEMITKSAKALESLQMDPKYYLHEITTADVHSGDSKQSMLVQLDNGQLVTLSEADSLIRSMSANSVQSQRTWLAMPAEAKRLLNKD